MIWGVLLPQNRVWNSTHILKKSKYIFHKNTYIFPWGTRIAITLIMTYIYLWGPLGSDLLQLKNGIWNPTYILKKSKYIPHKNTHIFSKENQNPNRLYHDLYFNLGTLRKWFVAFPCPKMDFWISCRSLRKIIMLRKICTFFTKICQFFLWIIKTPITLVMTYIFTCDWKCFPTSNWILEPQVHS